jgi:hypothetical protein
MASADQAAGKGEADAGPARKGRVGPGRIWAGMIVRAGPESDDVFRHGCGSSLDLHRPGCPYSNKQVFKHAGNVAHRTPAHHGNFGHCPKESAPLAERFRGSPRSVADGTRGQAGERVMPLIFLRKIEKG